MKNNIDLNELDNEIKALTSEKKRLINEAAWYEAKYNAHFGELLSEAAKKKDEIAKLKQEIKLIKQSESYLYKYLMNDPWAIEEREKSIKDDISAYDEYITKLNKEMNVLTSSAS